MEPFGAMETLGAIWSHWDPFGAIWAFRNFLDKAPQDPPPLKTVQKIGHPRTADFLYSFEVGPCPQNCTKLPVREDFS